MCLSKIWGVSMSNLGAWDNPPPLSNRGGRDLKTSGELTSESSEAVVLNQEYERYETAVIDFDGNLKVIPLRRGLGNTAFIDTLSFTFKEKSVVGFAPDLLAMGLPSPVTDFDVMKNWSEIAEWIFGFGISSPAPVGKGRFYDERWEMSVEGVLYGQAYIGGQNGTILIELTGKGCTAAKDGWEQRLYKFLNGHAYSPRITRCDVAKDFYGEEISPDTAWAAYQNGEFDKRGKRPLVAQIGSDWLNGTDNGKTLGVGSKNSSCYCRIYDKAKEQGDTSGMFWTRFELQFMGKNCLIPLDILLQPGQFWGGAFPICERLQNFGSANRYLSSEKRMQVSIDRVQEVAANQAGRAVNMMLQLGMTADEIVERLRRKDGALPERVNPASYSVEYALSARRHYMQFIHDEYEGSIELELMDEYGMILQGLEND